MPSRKPTGARRRASDRDHDRAALHRARARRRALFPFGQRDRDPDHPEASPDRGARLARPSWAPCGDDGTAFDGVPRSAPGDRVPDRLRVRGHRRGVHRPAPLGGPPVLLRLERAVAGGRGRGGGHRCRALGDRDPPRLFCPARDRRSTRAVRPSRPGVAARGPRLDHPAPRRRAVPADAHPDEPVRREPSGRDAGHRGGDQDPRRDRAGPGRVRGARAADDHVDLQPLGETGARGHGPADRHRRDRRRYPTRRDARAHHEGGPLADPDLRGFGRQHRRHPLRQGSLPAARAWREGRPDSTVPARGAVRARVEEDRGPAAGDAARQGAHRDRGGRIRRDERPRHHRGPGRGDRRGDPRRVRSRTGARHPRLRERGTSRCPRAVRRRPRNVRSRSARVGRDPELRHARRIRRRPAR